MSGNENMRNELNFSEIEPMVSQENPAVKNQENVELPCITDKNSSELNNRSKVNNSESFISNEESETTIVLEDSFSEDSCESSNSSSSSCNSSKSNVSSEYLQNKESPEDNKTSYEEFAKNLIIVDRKVEIGSPSFTINTKTGSMIITAKSKEDIEKVQKQYYSTRNRLIEQKAEITPEAFNFFHENAQSCNEDSPSKAELDSNITVLVTKEMIDKSLANLQLLKLPCVDETNVSFKKLL
jgi:hypothetical protein